jgi:hypothetical protein
MARMGVRASLILWLGLVCSGCSTPCEDIADRLRECCAKGPAELREGCMAYAKQLADDGNSDACQSYDKAKLEQCAP